MEETTFREGTVIKPVERLDASRISMIDQASIDVLDDPGITCFNEEAAGILNDAGCSVASGDEDGTWKVRIPSAVVRKAVSTAPDRVILGARDPNKRLVLQAQEPRLYFGTGSETNFYLKTGMEEFTAAGDPARRIKAPVHRTERGSIELLCESSRLHNEFENVDFFIRNVNVQDSEIDSSNKDVNVFCAAALYMTKHVQAGLTSLESLDDILKLGYILSGGEENFKKNPVFSFIACLVKSPLQMVEDTTQKVIEFARRGLPVVISSSPQGGSTAPIQEEGMVSLINAEILAGICLTQAVNPGTPVLYGAVPVRARLDTLHDLYGAPEFIHYNMDCVQMARHYEIPCYSTAGVGDARVPGLEASLEKVFSHLAVSQSGAQYIHYAFGLLDRTNIFSPVQAVIDNANIGMVKDILRKPVFSREDVGKAVTEIRKTVSSQTRLFAKYIRKYMRQGLVADPYPLGSDSDEDTIMERACEEYERICGLPGELPQQTKIDQIFNGISSLLPREKFGIK